ncbi:hypothetical protein ACOMHN_011440 [Nucella lapillus]
MFLVHVDKIFTTTTTSNLGVGPVLEFIIDHKLVGLDGFNWISGFVSMIIACERCLCVVTPLRSQTILKTRTTAVLLMIVSRGLACMYNPNTNTPSKIIVTSKFYERNKSYLNVLTFFLATVQPTIYVIVVFVTTIVTSVKLKKMIAWRQQTSSNALTSREVALTRMLIVVSVLYLLCSAPVMALGMAMVLVPAFSDQKYYNLYRTLLNVSRLASYVNATFNFCVYCSVGSRYRETLCQLFRFHSLVPVSAEK